MIVDSIIWIALKHKRDTWHERANRLRGTIKNASQLIVTDYIVLESYNFLLRKTSAKTALETLDMFLNSPKIKILYNNSMTFQSSRQYLVKYPNLSITDANIVWYAYNMGKYEVMSFDSGFDQVKNIVRISDETAVESEE